MATAHKWQFAPRFRRNAFGWKSDAPIQRIKEALSEIKAVAKKEPVLAAEGAVLFLEKLAPAIEPVDSSSGGIGSAINRAIETLVPIIVKADVSDAVREKWLDPLWESGRGCSNVHDELLERNRGSLLDFERRSRCFRRCSRGYSTIW